MNGRADGSSAVPGVGGIFDSTAGSVGSVGSLVSARCVDSNGSVGSPDVVVSSESVGEEEAVWVFGMEILKDGATVGLPGVTLSVALEVCLVVSGTVSDSEAGCCLWDSLLATDTVSWFLCRTLPLAPPPLPAVLEYTERASSWITGRTTSSPVFMSNVNF